MNMKPLEDAINKIGTQTKLAKLIGVRQSNISNWLYRDKKIPAEHVLAIEKVTGISRHVLRPDIYPK
jgi:DNA-binding transcriptional regulator YdaS (Cro superfamily)